MMGRPVIVLSQNTKRESGRKVQTGNISAAKTIADVIRTCLGPRAMMKMLLDPMGGIVMTNDGNAILREIQVQHPAAKSMIEISRTQDEEVGDGTTSVIILAGEMLAVAEQFLEQQMHPTVVISAYRQALDDMISILKDISTPVDVSSREMMLKIINSAINTKAINRWADLACNIALDAVKTVELEENGRKEIDIKKYAKVEKIPGGIIEDSCVLRGVMVNKDVTHPRMRRMIKNPRIVLLDCSLEYKKGESQTDIEITREEDFARILQMEEEYIQQICEDIIRLKPDLIFTEKGISDLAQHYLMKANITAIRRVRKTDNNRIARACGAHIASRTDELREEDVGTGAGLFEIKKIGDEYFTFITECKEPKACTIILRGASKEILAEVERNLQDAMQVCRNVLIDPSLVPGGGAAEMAVSHLLTERSKTMTGVEQWPYRAVAQALEVIPRTLIQNCGASTIRVLTSLRAKHTQEGSMSWGVNGETGALVDMKELGIWEPLAVKAQTYKTAVETAILLLRIDDIVSGHKKKGGDSGASPAEQ
ncbi:T-complex protein 1 subunit gamma [Acipenser oxyrinchus oxyrinchus]|uniref:T-complex protein 1 subunit gamma n=1 Tax=Acipenser oxyrinchus oxyrinchus TaxID=40147 RepID=A0AAD8CHF6_ACIOX|nr:T-complex protein 1 subunit gamma [Acipenser oxyrinchus oxyrinchus]